MIDTVALTLQQNEFKVMNWGKFRKEVLSDRYSYTKYSYNPNIKLEGYKPRLTIYDRFGTLTARVEFSAPKIIYNNNFDELTDDDFQPLVRKISLLLGTMSFQSTPEQLSNAEVSKIDYSKNLIFTDYTTSSMLITELSKIDLSAKLDQTTKNFRNDGHLLTYHANAYEICFYDKRKDLEQASKYGDKRAIEKDNIVQLDLFNNCTSDPLEVLRFEYRLDRQQIKRLFIKFGIESDLKFKSLFNKDISKKLLIGVWKLFEDNFELTAHNAIDPITMLENVYKAKPDLSLRDAMTFAMGFHIASSDNGGIKRFRDCIDRFSDIRSWYRIKSKLKGVGLSPSKTKLESLMQISKQLEQFEPTRLENYPQLSYSNVNKSKV